MTQSNKDRLKELKKEWKAVLQGFAYKHKLDTSDDYMEDVIETIFTNFKPKESKR